MAGYSTPAWTNGSAPAIDAAALLAMGQGIELAQHPYGVCSTAAATKAKTVTVDYSGTLSLFAGLCVRIKFSNSNTASAPTLNVNGTGAKAIKAYGTTAAGTWAAGQIISFVYDGTNWLYDGIEAYTQAQTLSPATAAAFSAFSATTPATPDAALNLLAVNCAKIATGSYTGTGTYGTSNRNSITFPFVPLMVVLLSRYDANTVFGLRPLNEYWQDGFLWVAPQNSATVAGSGYSGQNVVTVSGKTLSWFARNYQGDASEVQLNANGKTYYYLAIGV